jgi:hypothetical protein
LRALAAAGPPPMLVEAGPSGTLATFARQVLGPAVVALPAINQFGQDLKTMAAVEERLR